MRNNTMILAAAIALLVCLTKPARADRWTTTDTVVQAVVLASLAVDYHQTDRIINAPVLETHFESNPIMGAHGERVPPLAYFSAVAVAHTALVIVLPQPYRRIAQGVVIGVQSKAIHTNWSAGYTFEF